MKTLLFALLLGIALFAWADETPTVSKPDILELIEINGEIGAHTASAVKAQVEKINENPKVRAVLLSVDSPGGTVSASAAIYAELGKLKAPVVAYCESLCASGGIYAIMSPSVKYVAVGNSAWAGSVGVIAIITRYNRLLNWAKLDVETYKSGEVKDDGNPTRAPTEAERKRFQALIDELAQSFYEVVQKSRPKVDIEALKPAGMFRGKQVVAVGLADAVLTREGALRKAKELSGSKLIFTREELGKMSKAAHESTAYSAPATDPRADRVLDDLHFFANLVREIRTGEAVRFEYKAPYQF